MDKDIDYIDADINLFTRFIFSLWSEIKERPDRCQKDIDDVQASLEFMDDLEKLLAKRRKIFQLYLNVR